MIQVKILNINGNCTHKGIFNNIEEANDWIHIIESSERPWNYPKEGEYTILPLNAVNYTTEVRDGVTYYIVPKQYSIIGPEDLNNDPEYVKNKVENVVRKAIEFGQKISAEFIAENVILGITQANKTKEVRQALQEVFSALQTGSLHDAISEARLVTYRDDVFVTDSRLLTFVNKIENYLGLPLSTEL